MYEKGFSPTDIMTVSGELQRALDCDEDTRRVQVEVV